MHAIEPMPESEWGDLPPVVQLTREEGRAFFDREARRMLGISGDEFLRRLDAGEFDGIDEDDFGRRAIELELSVPFARPGADGA